MADFKWDNYEAEPTDSGKFDWNAHEVETPKVSQLESGLRGLAQGGSLGFADEGTGLAEALWSKAKGNPEAFGKLYAQSRDESRNAYKEAEKSNPKIYGAGELGGAIGSAFIPGLNVAKGASLATTAGRAALQGGLMGAGSTEDSLTSLSGLGDVAKGAALGGAGGAAGYGLSKAIGAAPGMLSRGADKLDQAAEDFAVKATGATGRQAEKFSEGTGRELLDRGIVKFGDTPEKVAERAAAMQAESGRGIGSALQELDKRGVTASVDNVVSSIQSQIDELSRVPGNEKIVGQLKNEIDNLVARGESNIPLSYGEEAKRAYQGQVNYASPEAEKKSAAKLASAFRGEVESAASAADPGIASKFMDDKKLYGTLAPVREAAEKRASQLNQSPFGGFGDLAAGGMAAGAGGPAAAAAVASRRFLAPRAASSLAVGADRLADVVRKAPQMLGKFAPALQAAAQRGTQGLAATHFILQQTQPEYQDLMRNMDQQEQDQDSR